MSPRRTTELGSTGIAVSRLGTGTNRWAKGENDAQVYEAYKTLLDGGTTFFDTAEIYTGGRSESLLGECLRRDGRRAVIASKYMPNPERRTQKSFAQALDATLERLGVETLDLYYIHNPPKAQTIEQLMDYLSEAIDAEAIRAAGVSNFDAEQMRLAAARLEERGHPLAANEVEYSLSNREPEGNGVLDACRELKVALVAYRPLSRGSLTSTGNAGSKVRDALSRIAGSHDATPGQVALAWLLHRDELVIPIPGATRKEHAEENAGSLDLALSSDEFNELDEATG